MPKIKNDVDGILDLDAKRKLLKEIEQDDLIELFKKNYKNSYTPVRQKKVALDQSVSISITTEEKEELMKEMKAIKKAGGGKVTLSSVLRSRVLIDVDIMEWKERALEGLKEFNGPNWNKREIVKNRNKYVKLIDSVPLNDDESRKLFTGKIDECNRQLRLLEKPKIKRSYRLRGRVTFNEANQIRWRAARLSLTIADYMRFLIFGYLPFSKDDSTLSIEARKRFYVSILDVAANGWGAPPEVKSCPNCLRYIQEIKELNKKVERLSSFIN